MSTSPALRAHPLTTITVALFAALLMIGLVAYKDYGISWDELPTREFGLMNVSHAVSDVRTLDSLRAVSGPAYERFGPLFEIVLVRAELAFTRNDPRATMLLRHLLTFLTYFAGVVLFHLFCLRRFTQGIALLATACLVASPPLFSHAFYNTKDISFLAAFVAAMLSLDVMLSNPSTRAVLVHALATLVLLGMRILGLFAVMLTAAAAFARRPTRRTVLQLALYGALVLVLLPLVWPVLRIDPIGVVKGAVIGSTSNPYTKTDLFRGRMIPANDLPRDYATTWMLVTTPMVITALFFVGVGRAVVSLLRQPREHLFGERQRDVIVLCWFFAPVLGTVVLRPVMYDAWRHLFFVYPALIYLAAIGMEGAVAYAIARLGEARRRAIHVAGTVALALCLAPAVAFMVANHPFEHLYFNRLAGRDMAQVKQRFELDYWGLSYRQLLEHIVRTDTSPVIRIRVANYPGLVNSLMLEPRDQMRIRYVRGDDEADYFVTNYRFHPEPYPYPREVFSVRVGNASVASVFRLRNP